MRSYRAIGLMSGTSLDGVDLVCVDFNQDSSFKILATQTVPYNDVWYNRLKHLSEQNAEVFAKTNIFYGHYLGTCVREFIENNQLENIDFVASHGQTIFHNPNKSYTIQIGSGASLAQESGQTTICDFRTTDMAYGGQGAPLVPFGEVDLFPEFKQFINVGGITNISNHQENTIIGYDVCVGNVLLNHYAEELGFTYDHNGELAKKGTIHKEMLSEINADEFFQLQPPKSLDADQILKTFIPLIDQYEIAIEDKLATIVEHISQQLAQQLQPIPTLLTGGGSFNGYLVERLQQKTKATITIPSNEIVEYKEALIFAYLGLKRIQRKPNALASVTGARKDTVNGAVYLP